MRFINNYTNELYFFIGFDNIFYNIFNKINDNIINKIDPLEIDKESITLLKNKYNINNLNDYLFYKDYKSIFIEDGLLEDDSIYMIYNKLAHYSSNNLTGEYLYIYGSNEEPLGFKYNNNLINPIDLFINDGIQIDKSPLINYQNNYNKLINNLNINKNKIYYFYNILDYFKIININIDIEYNLENWELEYNINDLYNYIIKKYWPLSNNINIIQNFNSIKKRIDSKRNQFQKLIYNIKEYNLLYFNNKIDIIDSDIILLIIIIIIIIILI